MSKTISLKLGDVIKPLPSKRSILVLLLAIFPGVFIIPGIQAVLRGHWSQAIVFAILFVLTIFSGGILAPVAWIWGICYAVSGHEWARDYLVARGWYEVFK